MDLFISALVTYLVVIDPPGCVPIFASLVEGAPDAHRRQMAVRSVAVAGGILVFFALVGEPLLEALAISLDAFRIAGGVMLFLLALEMVFEKRTQRRAARAEAVAREQRPPDWEDISVFPMGIPMIAGPGSIVTTMLLVGRAEELSGLATVLLAMGLVLLVTLVLFLAAIPILRLVGPRLEAVLTRILGVVLAALAVQFVIDGVRGSVG
ncbi:MAG: MarC family protein [Gemmatimonadetes bacterium]|nr:MarC family protein [Gemmatimonadota bacterium]